MREQWNVAWNMWKRRPIWMRREYNAFAICAQLSHSRMVRLARSQVCMFETAFTAHRLCSSPHHRSSWKWNLSDGKIVHHLAELCERRFFFCFTEEMQWCQNMLQLSSIQFLVHNVLCRVRPNTNDKLFFRFSLAGECCSWVWRHSKHIHCRIILHVEIRLNRSHRNT